MKKVVILLSTYNGKKFLKAQIESLLQLKKTDDISISIMIRDDGSDEEFKLLLTDLSRLSSSITVIKGENIGWKKSFWQLLIMAENFDYYAYCDQDDIWKDEKIVRAITKLEDYRESPALYYSPCDIINEEGSYLYSETEKMPDSSNQYLTCLKARGCCMVFNSILRKKLLMSGPPLCFAHDLWTLRVAAYIGTVILDDKAQIYYRMHESSATHVQGLAKRIKYSVKKYRTLENSYYYYALFLIHNFKAELKKENEQYLSNLITAKSSVRAKIRCFFSKDFVMQSFMGTCEIRLFMIFNYCQKYSYEQVEKGEF